MPTLLFRSSFQQGRRFRDTRLGWGSLAVGRLEVVEMPGGHQDMLVEPAVGRLAEKLSEAMRLRGWFGPDREPARPSTGYQSPGAGIGRSAPGPSGPA